MGRRFGHAERRLAPMNDVAKHVDEAARQASRAQQRAFDAAAKMDSIVDNVHMAIIQACGKVLEALESDKDPNSSATLLQMVMLTDAANRQLADELKKKDIKLQEQDAMLKLMCSKLGLDHSQLLDKVSQQMARERDTL